METRIANEALVFLCALPLGMLTAALYDIFRAMRIVFGKGFLVTFVEDLLFWALAGIGFTLFCFVFSNGIVRGYILFGAALGAVLYFCTVSVVFLRALKWITGKISKLFGALFEFFQNRPKKLTKKAEKCDKN